MGCDNMDELTWLCSLVWAGARGFKLVVAEIKGWYARGKVHNRSVLNTKMGIRGAVSGMQSYGRAELLAVCLTILTAQRVICSLVCTKISILFGKLNYLPLIQYFVQNHDGRHISHHPYLKWHKCPVLLLHVMASRSR